MTQESKEASDIVHLQMQVLEFGKNYTDFYVQKLKTYAQRARHEGHTDEMVVRSMSPVFSLLASMRQEDALDRQAGIQEQQGEILVEQKKILNRMESGSRSQGRWAIIISTISLILAGLAAYFSWCALNVSNEALRSSSDWQEKQIPILKQISEHPAIISEQPTSMKSESTH